MADGSCPRLERLPNIELEGGLRVAVAARAGARLLGLAMLNDLPPGWALLIPRCRSVHTLGMRFALDLIFLDSQGAALRVDRGVPPARVRSCRAADAVIETAAGRAQGYLAAWPAATR